MPPLDNSRIVFTQELADAICERIENCQSLREICQDDAMPGRTTVFKWLATIPEFANQYARAREAQADAMDDEILDTARATTNESAQANRVKIDAYKWRAARLAPKKYGDKLTLDGDLTLHDDPETKRARLAELLAKAQGLQAASSSVAHTGPDTTDDG